MGDPTKIDTQMGPVISGASRDRIAAMVNHAVKEGAHVLTGGRAPADMPVPFCNGYYYSPTVLEVDKTMTIWKEEVFGPVLVAIPFDDEEDAIALANDSPYGLAGTTLNNDRFGDEVSYYISLMTLV